MIVNCDKCEQDFDIEVKEQSANHELHGMITRQFFVCPHCGAEFNVGFSNSAVKSLLEENASLSLQNKLAMGGDRSIRKQYNRNLQKIKKISKKLETSWNKYICCSNAV